MAMTGLFLHELRRLLRERRTLAALVLSVVLVSFVSGWSTATGASGALWARRALVQLTLVEIAFGLLIVPRHTAGAIVGEREAATMELLAASPLSRFEIVAAKSLAGWAYAVLLFLAPLPCVVAITLRGGTSFETAFAMQGVLLSALTGAAAIGLLASRFARSSHGALLLAITGAVLWNLGPFEIFRAVERWLPGLVSPALIDQSSLLNPFYLVRDPAALHARPGVVAPYVAATLGLVVIAFTVAVFAPQDFAPSNGRRRSRRLGPIARAILKLGERHSWPPLDNPVLRQSLRTAEFGGLAHEALMFASPIVSFAVVWMVAGTPRDAVDAAWNVTLISIAVVTPLAAARSVPREIERNTMGMLIASSVDPYVVARGKIIASWLVNSSAILGFATVAMASALAPGGIERVIDGLVLASLGPGATLVCIVSLSTMVSFRSKRGAAAVLWTYGIIAVASLPGRLTLGAMHRWNLDGPSRSPPEIASILLLMLFVTGTVCGVAIVLAIASADRVFGIPNEHPRHHDDGFLRDKVWES